jgi:hypothetical protein
MGDSVAQGRAYIEMLFDHEVALLWIMAAWCCSLAEGDRARGLLHVCLQVYRFPAMGKAGR